MALALSAMLMVVVAACGGSSDGGDDKGASAGGEGGKKLKVGIIVEASGPYAPVFSPAAKGAQAVLDAANDAGGVNGYTFESKVYDSASAPAGGDAAVRSMLNDKVDVIISVSQFIDGALPLLQEANIPVFGYGVSPNWFGKDKTNLFSYTGDIVNYSSTALLSGAKADDRTKVGIVSDPSPGSTAGAKNWEQMVKDTAGFTMPLANFNLNPEDIAGINSLAQQYVDAGANVVLSTAPVGAAPLQAAFNQIGADVRAITPTEYGDAILKQYGDSIEGLLYFNFMATQQHDVPGWTDYRTLMTDAGFKDDITATFAPQGYVNAKVLLEAVKGISGDVNATSIVDFANADWTTSDLGGLIVPPTWPAAHDELFAQMSFSEVKDGKWVAFGDTTFLPGEPYTSRK